MGKQTTALIMRRSVGCIFREHRMAHAVLNQARYPVAPSVARRAGFAVK
jgi:hypothetical protein